MPKKLLIFFFSFSLFKKRYYLYSFYLVTLQMSRHDVDDPVMSQALRQAQLGVDEEVNAQNIIADALMNRPKGTSNAFGPKQKEYIFF